MRAAAVLASTTIVFIMGLALSAPVLATPVHDPACDPYGNRFGIYEQVIDTPFSHTEHVQSSFTLSGLYCGSQIDLISLGSASLVYRIDLAVPAGVTVPAPETIGNGAYVGTATINVLGWTNVPQPVLAQNEPVTIWSDRVDGGDCIDWDHLCYKGVASGPIPGHFWIVGTRDPLSGRLYKLTIQRFHSDTYYAGWGTGYTKIGNVTICTYAGQRSTNSCGSQLDTILQRNGDASDPNCPAGKGLYTATAAQKYGGTSSPVSTCVTWRTQSGGGKKHIDEY